MFRPFKMIAYINEESKKLPSKIYEERMAIERYRHYQDMRIDDYLKTHCTDAEYNNFYNTIWREFGNGQDSIL